MPDKKTLKHIIVPEHNFDFPEHDMLHDIVHKQTEFMKMVRYPIYLLLKEQTVRNTGSAKFGAVTLGLQDLLACITNESEEIRDWLPWKHWKKYDNFEIDLEEIRLEFIDMLHFVLEGMIYLGMGADDIYRYYSCKMNENLRRQEHGY